MNAESRPPRRSVGSPTPSSTRGVLPLAGLALALGLVLWGLLSWSGDDVTVASPELSSLAEEGAVERGDAQSIAAIAGGSDEATPTPERHALSDALCRLLFVDADSGDEVLCRRIGVSLDGEPIKLASSAGISVALPDAAASPSATLDIEAEAAGYVRLRARFSPGEGLHRVAMARGQRVELHCVADSDGAPAAGVRAVLLPPLREGLELAPVWLEFAALMDSDAAADLAPARIVLRDGAWRAASTNWHFDPALPAEDGRYAGVASWLGRSDAKGVLRWDGVPLAAGYRWGLLPPQHGVLTPEHERKRFAMADGSVQMKTPPPPGLSGRFDVQADGADGEAQPVQLAVQVLANSSVSGRVEPGPSTTLPAVRIYRVVQFGDGSTDNGVTSFEIAASVNADAGDNFSFEFSDLAPGRYVIRANWLAYGRDIHFAHAVVVLSPEGGGVDVGLVPTLSGPGTLTTLLGVVDQTGERVDADRVFLLEEGRSASAHLHFEVLPDSAELVDFVYEVVGLPLGREFVFRGLPAGRVVARAHPPVGVAVDDRSVVDLKEGLFEDRWDAGAASGTVAIDLQATFGLARRLRIVDSSGRNMPLPAVWLRPRRGDAAGVFQTRAVTWESDGVLDSTAALSLGTGSYEVAAAIASGGGASDCGWFAKETIEFGKDVDIDEVVTLQASEAAGIRGRFVDAEGAPVANETLVWSADPIAGDLATGWQFAAVTDSDGVFSAAGIPPGVRLLGMQKTPSIAPLRAGAVTDLGDLQRR